MVAREGIRLAFVAALQYLSARQRAVLIMRDVLDWPAAEAADLLGMTTTAVNSALRRARDQIAAALPAGSDAADVTGLAEPATRHGAPLLDRYAAAIENADASALAGLLREDIALEMPPLLTWFAGRDTVLRFVAASLLPGPGLLRLVPVTANGQPAFAVYERGPDGTFRAHAIQVLTITDTGIARIVAFANPALFGPFGLPRTSRPVPDNSKKRPRPRNQYPISRPVDCAIRQQLRAVSIAQSTGSHPPQERLVE